MQSPTGYLLAFFPASFGLLLAYEDVRDLVYLPVFFIGSILVRSAGCIINDLLDQDFDKHVDRTKNRPIASGAISNTEALLFLSLLLGISFSILLSLNQTAIYLGIATMVLTSLYPLMKRITYFPQVFLGITFNMGCLIGYATIQDAVSYDAVILYIACGFWTVGYDTIYGFMDIKDDKKIGVKSTSIFFEHSPIKSIIWVLYVLFLTLFAFAVRDLISMPLMVAFFACIMIMLWITIYLDVKDEKNCLLRFKANNYIGFILFLAMLLEKL
jgi:4-hydroxybenzoate polyprenyltransferase